VIGTVLDRFNEKPTEMRPMYRNSSQSGTRLLPRQESIDDCLGETPVIQPREQLTDAEIARLRAVSKCFGRRQNASGKLRNIYRGKT
jgi:hypothetical protein